MSSKSRRRIRPHERAKVDQHMAHARNRALAEPNTIAIVTEYLDPGTQCCWCDCTLEWHREFGDCDGCPADAVFGVTVMVRTEHTVYPICRGHYRDFLAHQAELTRNVPNKELHVYDAYDEDRPGG